MCRQIKHEEMKKRKQTLDLVTQKQKRREKIIKLLVEG